MYHTLITGASNGLGLEMAKKCAQLGRSVLLVSLPNQNLAKIADNIGKEYKLLQMQLEISLLN